MYAVRRDEELRLFHSRWGALSLAWDLFWGPDAALELVSGLSPTSKWLDSIDCEAAVALNVDERRAAIVSSHIGVEEARVPYAELLALSWGSRGWTATLVPSLADVAAVVGVSSETVLAPPFSPPTVQLDALGGNIRRHGLVSGIASIRQTGPADQDAPRWKSYVVDFDLAGLLRNGPAFLEAITRMPQLESYMDWNALWRLPLLWLRGASANPLHDIDKFARIDPERRQITLRGLGGDDRTRYAAALKEDWPGWEVEVAEGGADAHFAAIGRQRPALIRQGDEHALRGQRAAVPWSDDQVWDYFAGRLLGVEGDKRRSLRQRERYARQTQERDSSARLAADFLEPVPPGGPLPPGDRSAWLGAVFDAWRTARKGPDESKSR